MASGEQARAVRRNAKGNGLTEIDLEDREAYALKLGKWIKGALQAIRHPAIGVAIASAASSLAGGRNRLPSAAFVFAARPWTDCPCQRAFLGAVGEGERGPA